MKKVFLFFCLCIVLCVSAFADTSVSFESLPVSFESTDGHTYLYECWDGNIVDAAYKAKTNGNFTLYLISDSQAQIYKKSGDTVVESFDLFSWEQVENVQAHYRSLSMPQMPSGWTPTISSFSVDASVNDILTAWVGYDSNRPGSGGGSPGSNDRLSSFTLPRGNVAYFKVSVASDVSMTSHMPTLNNLVQFGNNSLGPWGDTGQRWGYASALPDSSTTFPLGSQVPLTWTKDSSQNILGQTKIGHATKACTTGQWYVFFNPGVSGLSANGLNDIAGASVDFTGYFSELKVFPLSERLDYSNPLGGTFESYSDDGYASYFDGTINENGTVTWENQDGELSSPAIGGQNAQYGDLSTEGLIKRVQEYLANILDEIKSLFTFGYEAIQSLVGIMFDFVNVFQGLYSWLPQPVHAALVSAVSVAVVIGVFKVFL